MKKRRLIQIVIIAFGVFFCSYAALTWVRHYPECGCQAFQHDNFKGFSVCMRYHSKYINNLKSRNFNDEISSIIVNQGGGVWGFYEHTHYRGKFIVLGPGRYTKRDLKRLGMGNDKISSIKFEPLVEDRNAIYWVDFDHCLSKNNIIQACSAVRRHIPNPEVYHRLFSNKATPKKGINVQGIIVGLPLLKDAKLFQVEGDPKVYLYDQVDVRLVHLNKPHLFKRITIRRWITSPESLNLNYFNWSKIVRFKNNIASDWHFQIY